MSIPGASNLSLKELKLYSFYQAVQLLSYTGLACMYIYPWWVSGQLSPGELVLKIVGSVAKTNSLL